MKADNNGYDMKEQNKIEEAITPSIMRFLENKYNKEAICLRHNHTAVDIQCNNLTFDIKADTRMADTNNLFVETVSVFEKNQVKKKGWLYNSIDEILYVDMQMRMIPLQLKALQKFEKEILNFPERKIFQKGKSYVTLGRIVPIDTICCWLNVDFVHFPLGLAYQTHLGAGSF